MLQGMPAELRTTELSGGNNEEIPKSYKKPGILGTVNINFSLGLQYENTFKTNRLVIL